MSERRVIDLIYGCDGPGCTVRSPQVPGLVGGRENLEELVAATPEMLAFAGVRADGIQVRQHVEVVVHKPDLDVVIRRAEDAHAGERLHVADRLVAALSVPSQRDAILSAPRTLTGEVLFICAVASDRISWVTDQVHPAGDVAVVTLAVADEFIWATHIAIGDGLLDGRPIEYFGFSRDTTLGEFMRAQTLANHPPRVVVSA